MWRDNKCEIYGYQSQFNNFFIYSLLYALLWLWSFLRNSIIVKFKVFLILLGGGPLRTLVDHSWTPFVSHMHTIDSRLHTSLCKIHPSFNIQCSSEQNDSLTVSDHYRGPVFHKEVTWFIMRCVEEGRECKTRWARRPKEWWINRWSRK